jgi:hypothetical protein
MNFLPSASATAQITSNSGLLYLKFGEDNFFSLYGTIWLMNMIDDMDYQN